MNLIPVVPDSGQDKPWWKKPENLTAAVLLGVGGLAVWSYVVPILTAIIWGTIQFIEAGAVLALILWILFDEQWRLLAKNILMLIPRKLTNLVIETDPIGIMENTEEELQKELSNLNKGVAGAAAAKEGLERKIADYDSAIQKDGLLAAQAIKKAKDAKTVLNRKQYELASERAKLDAGRKMESKKNLGGLLNFSAQAYDMLQRMQQLAEFNLENLRGEIENTRSERDAIMETWKSLGPAKKLLMKNGKQMEMFNRSKRFLAEDNARKVGAIKDFSRIAEKYFVGMDIEQGASIEEGNKILAELEQKMLSAGAPPETIPATFSPDRQLEPVPRKAAKIIDEWNDLLK